MYIGRKEIKQTKEVDEDFFEVEFDDGSTCKLLKAEYNAATSAEASDEDVRNAYANLVAEKVLQVLLEYNVKLVDAGFILNKVSQSVSQNYIRMIEGLTKTPERELRFKQVDDILKSE